MGLHVWSNSVVGRTKIVMFNLIPVHKCTQTTFNLKQTKNEMMPCPSASTLWIKWSMIEASLKNQRGYSADLYCCQQLWSCCCHSVVSNRSDLWPLTSTRYFPSTQPPLIGYFLFVWTILCEPQKWLWCRENPTRSAFCDLQPRLAPTTAFATFKVT